MYAVYGTRATSPPFPPPPMTLTTGIEVVASPSHSVITLQAGPPAGPSPRPSFESRKTYRPDVITLESLGIEEAPTPTQSEPPVMIKAYTLNIRKLNIKFAAICLALFLEGWNLGATGPLIPAIQKYYRVSLRSSAQDFLTIRFGTGGLHHRLHDVSGSMYCGSSLANADRFLYTDKRIHGSRVSFLARW